MPVADLPGPRPRPRGRRRTLIPAATTAALALLALAGCGGGGGGGATPPAAEPSCPVLPDEVSYFAGSASNEWNDVAIDGQRRIWLAGYADGQVGQSNLEPAGDSRAVVRVLSATGQPVWDSGATLDTPGTDVAESLAFTREGGVVVLGRTTGSLDGQPNRGQFDGFLAWTAQPTSGAWASLQFGDAAPQHPRRLAIGPDGDWHVGGQDDVYVPSNYVERWSDVFALRWRPPAANAAPQPRWTYQAGSAANDFAEGLAVSPDGAATYLAGQSTGGLAGAFLRKFDADGRLAWTARYSASPLDNVQVVRALADGTIWIAGNVYGSFQGHTALGQQDFFVARVAADDGRVLASWQFGTPESDWLTDFQVAASGELYVLGETQGRTTDAPNQGGADLFMARVSQQGQWLAARQWGTLADETARRLAVGACGQVVAVGHTTQQGRRVGVLWSWRL